MIVQLDGERVRREADLVKALQEITEALVLLLAELELLFQILQRGLLASLLGIEGIPGHLERVGPVEKSLHDRDVVVDHGLHVDLLHLHHEVLVEGIVLFLVAQVSRQLLPHLIDPHACRLVWICRKRHVLRRQTPRKLGLFCRHAPPVLVPQARGTTGSQRRVSCYTAVHPSKRSSPTPRRGLRVGLGGRRRADPDGLLELCDIAERLPATLLDADLSGQDVLVQSSHPIRLLLE